MSRGRMQRRAGALVQIEVGPLVRLLSPADLQLVLLPFGPADAEQVNALIAAARGGCASDVEEMLRRPQDPNLVERTIFGLPGFDTPLLAAVEVGDIEKTRLLLEAGAAVTEEVLEAASLDLKLLDLLLDYGAPGTGQGVHVAL